MPTLSPWFARASSTRAALWVLLALTMSVGATAADKYARSSDAQRDPELRAVVQAAISEAECFEDKYDSAVWYVMMEPKLRTRVPDRAERLDILKTVWCEARRPGVRPLPPGLVLALVDVESGFRRYAVSAVGAVGLMQIMPYWPEQLGMQRHELTQIVPNIRMGCAILRHYLQRENYDYHRALARYNGSVGRRVYSDVVVGRWTRQWNHADDLARKTVVNSPTTAAR